MALGKQPIMLLIRVGSKLPCVEEVVAELANLFLTTETALPHDPPQHAAYIDS